MNKTIISILLLAVIATAHCETQQVQGWDDAMTCVKSGSDLVGEVATYLKNKKWFDGPAVGRIVSALKKTYDGCKNAFNDKLTAQPVELAAYSTTCKHAVVAVKSSVTTMRSNLRWKKFKSFSREFGNFKAKINYAKRVC